MNKTAVFKEELSWIRNPDIANFANAFVECAPEYFFRVAASSTGKYHPGYALGAGGLVRHTKAAAHILHELLQLEMFDKYTADQKDLMLVSILGHDFFKHGLEKDAKEFTAADHPTVCAQFIRDNEALANMLTPAQIDFVCGCIASHMGQWNTDYRSKKEILPKPVTGPQNFVHLADYLASRKYLTFEFGDAYYTPAREETAGDDAEETRTDELDAIKAKIVDVCKEKIAGGVENRAIYALIAECNGGNRNPNSVTTMEVAEEILHKLEGFHG